MYKIIINNVDVSKCKHLDTFEDVYQQDIGVRECMMDSSDCQDNPRCYFKQLCRLKKRFKSLERKING